MKAILLLATLVGVLGIPGVLCVLRAGLQSPPDPAAWGSDHVGKPVPEFLGGDECLFCHRSDVGPRWSQNRHQQTLREADPELAAVMALKENPTTQTVAAEVKLVLGGRRHLRYLKPSAAYGQLDLLSTAWAVTTPGPKGKLEGADHPHWDARTFATGCAGCHATGVDPATHAFSSPSLDCYVCHGDVNPKHSKDTSLVILAKKRNDPARAVTSICAQCHVRTGKSRSTRLPYPNNFVAGDNLFRDFDVDFGDQALKALNPADRHVLENVRDVVLGHKEEVTCLSCHDVHAESSRKHRRLPQAPLCLNCHHATGSKKVRPSYEVHSQTCGY